MDESDSARASDASAATAERTLRAGPPVSRIVSSDTLLAGQPQLAIRHRDSVYFLRQTRFGKLILTK